MAKGEILIIFSSGSVHSHVADRPDDGTPCAATFCETTDAQAAAVFPSQPDQDRCILPNKAVNWDDLRYPSQPTHLVSAS
jgi:hypothetical protein